MCCFSQPVELVADTSIFARASVKGRQFLVYSMKLKAKDELAMILPIPTPKGSAEDAVKFLNLEKYADFFDDMRSGFPLPPSNSRGPVGGIALGEDRKLVVVKVGSYVASFVPSVADFPRLDEQFRLPPATWDKLPQYKNWGFAVFKLNKGEQKVHPMAFEFPRADPRGLFFPTVHIHDGKVHAKADFDHHLYFQPSAGESVMRWEESPAHAVAFMRKIKEAHGLVDAKQHVYRRKLMGVLKNEDVYA